MRQFDEQDVHDPHGAQQQGLDGDGQAKEDGDGEVGEHAGDENVVGQEAESVTRRLVHNLRGQRTGRNSLALARELKKGLISLQYE